MFTIKSKLINDPTRTIIFMFSGTVVISAYIIRVLEIPFFRACKHATFDHYFSSIWFTVVTITTIGYGDISPGTPPGQIFTILLAFWGSLLLSLLVVCLSNIFELNQREKLAASHLRMTRKAANTITLSL